MVDEDEDAYAGDGMSSSEHVPAAAPSSNPLSDAPPLDRTSNSAVVDPHNYDPFFEPLGTPARLNAGASLARSPSAWRDSAESDGADGPPAALRRHTLQAIRRVRVY